MTVEVGFFELLVFLVGLLISFFGAVFAASKVFASQFEHRVNEKFKAQSDVLAEIKRGSQEERAQWHRVERMVLDLRAELPVAYVRRDDYIRGQTVLEAKMDGLALKIENAQLRGIANVG